MLLPSRIGPSSCDVEQFRRLVAQRLGLQFEDAKLELLETVLARRLRTSSMDCSAYFSFIEHGATLGECGELASELTVPETYFFRDPNQFQALSQHALPELVRERPHGHTLQLLSAGCASGEEAYSLAIVARESVSEPGREIRVRGVDLNPAVLERARKARYSPWALRETSMAQRKWFRPVDGGHALDEGIRSAVQFDQRNLVLDDPELWPREHYDVVFCRNVLMYLTPDVSRALTDRIARSIAPGGYLFLGHAESLRGLPHEFHLRQTNGTFYYQRSRVAEPRAGASPAASPGHRRRIAPGTAESGETSSWVETINRASDRIGVLASSAGATVGLPETSGMPDVAAALELLSLERFSEALDLLRGLPDRTGEDPGVLILKAVLHTHCGELARARDICEHLLECDEQSAGAHYTLALCEEAGGDVRAAMNQDRIAIYLDPTFAMPRLHLGMLSRRSGDFESARGELREALRLLQREDSSRLLLFGGGFTGEALASVSRAELAVCEARS